MWVILILFAHPAVVKNSSGEFGKNYDHAETVLEIRVAATSVSELPQAFHPAETGAAVMLGALVTAIVENVGEKFLFRFLQVRQNTPAYLGV